MKKCLSGLIFLAAGMTVAIPYTATASTHPVHKKAVKKAEKKTEEKADDEKQANAAGTGIDFQCELGNKLTIYENADDKNRIGLRWNKKMHELTRVQTSTGADRFENASEGLVWIGIPAKGMLLDSKKGQQLANECKNHMQMGGNKSKV